ncbi:histidinol-phosphate transaminase [Spirosoma utsteinense]|uniref:Histidinol-phosphate aminotransferase n=1 Tax=Spirosoma utsteinense TaxID=2585773 RepID=A0ABR6W8L6_9BACT|nr:histidinol-phosphate transaminase [Spirosoma utsteinense]MBC3787228.1 histidinol-phosphate aminotransferase [Spirosoma utsteinense]MBC3792914.1 histidinol-phosphate aminotransferase [Spirosoma utsteinense]
MTAFSLKAILRPHILTLMPYSSARDEYTGKEGVFLDANENPLGPSLSESTAQDSQFNRYPDPHQWAIKQKLAPIKGVRPEQIFLGNGSDEPIDLLVRATCTPGSVSGDSILIMPPTYGMYEVSATINDVAVTKVPLTPDFQVDVPAVLAAIDETTKLIWLCSPNNPSGNRLRAEDIRTVLEAAREKLVIVDEAYIDFSADPSWTRQLDTYPNLVVLQTFSKAWGLAGLRLGMCFASEELIRVLNKIKPPYNISAPTQALALEALDHEADKDNMVREILHERQVLADNLRTLPSVQVIHPSDANFLLVRFADAGSTFAQLIDHQVIVRDRSKVILCDGCLRISVGTRAENERLVEVLHHLGRTPTPTDLPLGTGEDATKPELVSNA